MHKNTLHSLQDSLGSAYLTATTDNSADDQFHETVQNFSADHNASQTTIGKNTQTIKQQAQSIAQLTAQMNSL